MQIVVPDQVRGPKPKYPLTRPDFFHDIDDEASAYWLGFLAADGYVCTSKQNGYYISLMLAERDRAHVQKFADAVGYPGLVRRYKRPEVVVIISCRQMIRDLIKHGVGPHKTDTLKPLTGVPDDMLRHCFRGLVDGDGSIGFLRTRAPFRIFTNLVGTTEVVRWYDRWLQQNDVFTMEGDHKYSRVGSSRNTVLFTLGGSRIVKNALTLLYNGATVYLLRKKELADKCLASCARDMGPVLSTRRRADIRAKVAALPNADRSREAVALKFSIGPWQAREITRGLPLCATYCAHCGAPFVPERAIKLYCSERCRQAAYRRRKRLRLRVGHQVQEQLFAL